MGRYSEVSIQNKLSFSWEWKSEPGHVSYVDIQIVKMVMTEPEGLR